MVQLEHAGSGFSSSPWRTGDHVREVEVRLPVRVQQQLERIRSRREELEDSLTELDVRIYDLESTYLRQCVELGGALFDGFGMERTRVLNSGMIDIGPAGVAGITCATAAGNSGGATSVPSPTSAAKWVTGVESGGVLPAAASERGATGGECTALAFHARLHALSPNERVFSSSSVGALGRVERVKAIQHYHNGARMAPSQRSGGRRGRPSKSSKEEGGLGESCRRARTKRRLEG